MKSPISKMSSVCISSCVHDTLPTRRIIRGTYVNIYKWPDSEAEFIRSLSFRSSSSSTSGSSYHNNHLPRQPKVVDSISCRQLYLRSYTFTRKESVNEKTKKCIGRVKDKVPIINNYGKKKKKGKENHEKGRIKGKGKGKGKEGSCAAALKNIFTRLLFCSASVGVAC